MIKNDAPTDVALIQRRPADAMFPHRRERIAAHKCASEKCDGDGTAYEFRDENSLREYKISGMCQACQDVFFGANFDPREDEAEFEKRMAQD